MLTGQILLQLIVILIVVQLFGSLGKRIGQQWVIGEILAGIALGPSLLGALLPGVKNFIFPVSTLPTLQTLGDVGLILYMFSLGTRLDTHMLLRQSRLAALTSISGILLPLVLGVGAAFFLFPTLGGPKASYGSFMLMIGTAMAITAFPVLARLLAEKKMLATRLGILALTSAAVDDVVAWCLLALVVAVANAQGLPSVILTVGITLLFIVCMLTLVRSLVSMAFRSMQSKHMQTIMSMLLLLISAYTTNAIGIHPIFGAFLMGIILPRKVQLVEFVHNVDQVNGALLLPLYFVFSGLRTQIGLISTPWLWFICLLIILLACTGKIVGGMAIVRLAGESWRSSFSFGVLINTRGLVELIVLNIGLDLGILSSTVFAMLVIMALVTTMMASPLLFLLGHRQTEVAEAVSPIEESGFSQEEVPE